jgi:cell division protein FtsA
MFRIKKTAQKKHSELNIALDIGTEYVKTVIFKKSENKIEVVGFDRTKQEESSMSGAFIISITNVLDTVDKSIGNALNIAKQHYDGDVDLPEKAILGIAGELIQGVTILVNLDRDNPDKPIDEKEVSLIIDKIRKNSFDNIKEELAEELGLKQAQITEIETVINSVYIDGVKVADPVGFTGSELVYRVFSTFAPKIHVDSIKNVTENLGIKVERLVVQPYALALAHEGARANDFSAILVDIGGGTTDVAVVENGEVIGTRMFAIGGRVFTKRIQKALACSYEEAENLKISYCDSKLGEKKSALVKDSIHVDVETWLTGLELALSDFEDIKSFPPRIFLCGGGAILPDIQEGLLEYPWLQVLPFQKFPSINFFFPNKVRNTVDKTRMATQLMDVTPLALARMSLNH